MKNISDAAALIKAEISRLQGILSHLEDDAVAAMKSGYESVAKALSSKPTQKAKSPVVKKGKRTRRSSADVKAQAMEMVAFIKSKGKEGVAGKEISAKFGPVLPSIKAFINGKVEAAHKVKSKGAASKTVYYV